MIDEQKNTKYWKDKQNPIKTSADVKQGGHAWKDYNREGCIKDLRIGMGGVSGE